MKRNEMHNRMDEQQKNKTNETKWCEKNHTFKVKNKGHEATDGCTSTSEEWLHMVGRYFGTNDPNRRWRDGFPTSGNRV
jgi:hypothetical protein